MRTIRVLFLAVIACAVASANAATFVVPPDEWMVDDAAAIVSGTVVDAYVRYDSRGDLETVYSFSVDHVLKGHTSESFEIVEWGGHLGDTWMFASGSPRYELGHRYVVFAVQKPNGNWTTLQMTLGRFEYVHSAAGEVLIRDVDEIRGWDIEGNAAEELDRDAEKFATFIRDRARGVETTEQYLIGATGTRVAAPRDRRVTANFVDYDFTDACNVGVDAWSNDSGSTVNLSISGSPASGNTKDLSDSEQRIIEEDPNGDISGTFNGAGVVATAFSRAAGSHMHEGTEYLTITHSDIVTQNGVKASSLGQSKFRTALTHEVGHTLGFRHADKTPEESNCGTPLPCASSAVMTAQLGAHDGQLQSWDKDAVRAAYGDGGLTSDYAMRFCTAFSGNTCTTFTELKARRATPSISFRIASQACAAPGISTHPQNKSIAAGATTSLSVTASGSSPFTYQWYIGNSGDESTPTGTSASTLTNLSPATTTSYWVKVTNSCGSINSNTATITVQACTPASITTQPQPKTTSIGVPVRMSVSAAGTAPLSYQWYVGNSGDTSSPIAGATSSTPNITLNATANVWGRVTNSCGTADSNAVQVTVNACPDVVVGTPTATGAGTNWTLSVTASSTAAGPLTYEWYRGSNPGSPSAPKVGEGQTLPVVVNTLTQFWAKVTNSCGTSKASELVVVAPCQLPVIVTQPADRTIPKYGTTQLTVGITGEGVAIQWYQGLAPDKSTPLPAGTSATVGPLETTTSYWASLTNDCGEISTRTVTVTVDESCVLARITAQPEDRTVSAGASTELAVTFIGENTTVQWYRGTAPDKSNPLAVGASVQSGPILATTSFWATLTNACGEVSTRTVIAVIEGSCVAPSIATQPLAQDVKAGQTTTLTVAAAGTAALHYQWYEGDAGVTTKPVGTDAPSFTTPPVFGTSRYWVKVTNACGEASSSVAEVRLAMGRRRAARS